MNFHVSLNIKNKIIILLNSFACYEDAKEFLFNRYIEVELLILSYPNIMLNIFHINVY